jgi:hypothetical protein
LRAVIVVGKANQNDQDDQRFHKIASWVGNVLSDYFRNRLCSGWTLLSGASSAEIAEKLQEIILDNPEEDLCLLYIGHGAKDGWAVLGTSDDVLKYESLRLILAHHCGCLIFVNDCCYAMAGQKALEGHAGESLFLAAAPDNYLSNNFIVYHLFVAWLHEQQYYPVAYIAPHMKPDQDCVELYDNIRRGPAVSDGGEFVSLRAGFPLDHLMFRSP